MRKSDKDKNTCKNCEFWRMSTEKMTRGRCMAAVLPLKNAESFGSGEAVVTGSEFGCKMFTADTAEML